MSRNKIIGTLIIVISILVVGCTKNNTNDEAHNLPQEAPDIQQETKPQEIVKEDNNKISKEQYNQILLNNYEKYIKPLDLEEYNDLNEFQSSKGITDNKELVDNIKTNINDNKNNLISFKESMSEVYIEDTNINEANNMLLQECNQYIDDLNKKETYLEVLDEDTLQKPNSEFTKYLESIVNDEQLDKSKFKELINEIETNLDQNTDTESKIE